jgi:hypothetical protein
MQQCNATRRDIIFTHIRDEMPQPVVSPLHSQKRQQRRPNATAAAPSEAGEESEPDGNAASALTKEEIFRDSDAGSAAGKRLAAGDQAGRIARRLLQRGEISSRVSVESAGAVAGRKAG